MRVQARGERGGRRSNGSSRTRRRRSRGGGKFRREGKGVGFIVTLWNKP